MAIFNKRVPTFFYELLNKPLEEVKKILGIGQQTFTDTNITEGTLNTATTDRTVDLGGNSLTVTSNDGSYFGNYILNSEDFEITTSQVGAGGDVVSIFSDISSSSLLSLYSKDGNYRIGTAISSTQPPQVSDHNVSYVPKNLVFDSTGTLKYSSTAAFFISDANLNPASPGNPTFAEVESYVAGLFTTTLAAAKNRFLYYTGTSTSTDPYTHVYYFTGDNKLYELGGSKFEDPLIVTSTNLNATLNTVNSPTTNQVLTYLNSQNGVSAYRNRYVLYDRNGNNFITKVFYVTNDDRILIVHDPNPVRYITVNISYPMIDTNLDNKIIGSVAIPQDLHVNGNYQIQQIKYNCVVNGTGTNTVPITVNDAGGYVTDFTVNAASGGGQNNLGGVFLDFNDGKVLFFEAGTVTGAIEHLSITLTLG